MVVGYNPSDGDGEERERFWNDMERIVDRVGNGYWLCVVEDLNGWVEDKVRVVDFYAEKGLCVGDTYFEHKSLHNTRVARGQDRLEVKKVIDLELVKKDMLHYV